MKTSLFVFVILIFGMVGCNIKPEPPISKSTMENLILDITLADGVFLSYSDMTKKYREIDSADYYYSIFQKYQISRADFDSALSYYSNHLPELVEIYDQVIEKLNIMETEVDKEISFRYSAFRNKWKDKENWVFPDDTSNIKLNFTLQSGHLGIFELNTRIRIYKNDSTLNPHIKYTAYGWNSDDSARYVIKDSIIPLIKNNWAQVYRIMDTIKDSTLFEFKGYLLGFDNPDSIYYRHAEILNIQMDAR